MNDPATEASARRSPLLIGGVVLAGLVVLLLLLIPTCRAPSTRTGGPAGGQPNDDEQSRAQCERTLLSALDGLQPQRLGLSSEARVMVDTLNNWMNQCAPDSQAFTSEADRALRERLLTEDGASQTSLERFRVRDAEHVRNSLLAKAIVDRLSADARTDIDRAVDLFYYVVRTVQLVSEQDLGAPMTPYESLLIGAGTPADRAWTYALLLRQLRLDAVMVQPRTPDGTTPYWIFGVVIPDDGVYLFDPRLGLPISAQDVESTPLPRRPATLAQASANDALLRQYDLPDREYPLTADLLKTVDVFAIGTSSTWAPRVGILQSELQEPAALYDGLASNPLRESGLIDRLIAAGEDGLWSADQVHVWPYPEAHWGEFDDLSDAERSILESQLNLLEAPFVFNVVEEQQVITAEKSNRTLRRARIEQLLGNFDEAQQVYLQARLSVRFIPPEQLEAIPEDQRQFLAGRAQLNYIAADMATYWAAQCQYERGDYQVASESALSYLRRSDGHFLVADVYLASLSLAHNGRAGDAAALLSQEPPQVPQFSGDQHLIQYWRQQTRENPQPDSADQNSKTTTKPDAETAPGTGDQPSANDAKTPGGASSSEQPVPDQEATPKATDSAAPDGAPPSQ